MTTQQLPPEWKEKISKIAQDFYDNDKDLTVDDRKQLVSCFRKQTFAFPLITIPVLFGAIKIPRQFFKGKRLRVAQLLAGFGGVMIGTRLSQIVGYQWNLNSLPNNSPVYNCYSILGKAPPQLGLRYYGNTVKHPELKMKDPKETDWDHSLGFPLSLVFTQKPVEIRPPQHLYQRPDREAERWRQGYEQTAKDSRSVQDNLAEFESNNQTGGSSWDRIRKGSQPVPAPAISAQPNSSFASEQDHISKDQLEFDRLLERERQMSDGHHDDFANDEKKW